MLSKSSAEPLALWIGSRMPGLRFAPVALVLVIAGAAAGRPSAIWTCVACLVALVLIFQFRLWDDLADLAKDRVLHPERVLPRCESTAVFRAAAWIAFAATLGLLAVLSGAGAVAAYLALCAFYGAWYVQSPQAREGLIGAHIVVFKYPAFVLLIAPRPLDGTRTALACAAIYFAFSAYELIHDPAHRSRTGAPALAAVALVIVGFTLGALIVLVLKGALA